MFFSGFCDEAGPAIETQIKAHKEIGFGCVELRNTLGKQFTDVTDEEFESICAQLDEAGLKISCYGSGIANWATKITDPFENSVETLKRVIPRMQKTGTKFIRVMSYPNDEKADNEWRDESVKRMKELGKMAEDGGIILAVENCDGWASMSADNYASYFEMVDSPAVKAVYDTGNPASHGHTNTWEWYQKCREHIVYVHIKAHTGPQGGEDKGEHCFPDDPKGASKVMETIKDLFATGYDGGFSIEPHLKAIAHEGKDISDEEAAFLTYVEYGKRLKKMVEEAKG